MSDIFGFEPPFDEEEHKDSELVTDNDAYSEPAEDDELSSLSESNDENIVADFLTDEPASDTPDSLFGESNE